ncbi:MAG TPA: YncE family protein [Candidatus Dormibacteraeota bacterium]|nr:YncE family protein [Candidatus Dormibacteraeota bacterium]
MATRLLRIVGFPAFILLLASFALAAPVPSKSSGYSGYRVLKTYHLGGTQGWDYIRIDSALRRLFIGRGSYMDVVDVDTGKVEAKLTGMPGVHGIALARDLGRGFTVNGDNDTSTILDLKTLKIIGTVKTGKDPDGNTYDPATKRVFIMNSAGNDATAIDAVTGKVVGTIPLDGQPEFTVSDGKGHIFVNITNKSQMLEFDARTLKVLHRWPLAPCEYPSGLSMDRANHLLFSVCSNNKMVVTNANTGKVVAALPVGADPDASIFDPATQNAFSSNGGCGNLTIIHEDSPDKFHVVQTVDTQTGARTMALDGKTHNIFLITAMHGHGSTARSIVPGTFVALVVGR